MNVLLSLLKRLSPREYAGISSRPIRYLRSYVWALVGFYAAPLLDFRFFRRLQMKFCLQM